MLAGMDEKCTILRLFENRKTFSKYKFCRNAADVTFQNTNRPSVNHQKSKYYYNFKHHLYGYKFYVSVLPTGIALGRSNYFQVQCLILICFTHAFIPQQTSTK